MDDHSGNAVVGGVATSGRSHVNAVLDEFVEATGEIKVCLKASKKIFAGEEIFIDYSDSYWTKSHKIPGSRDLRCRPVWAMKSVFLKTVNAVTTAWKKEGGGKSRCRRVVRIMCRF